MKKEQYLLQLQRTVACLLLALLFVTAPAQAETSTPAAGKVLRVGFFAFDGYHMQDAVGRRSGYGYDFLQELARFGDWTYEYVGYDKSWAEMQKMLADGEIDLLTSVQKTPERLERFAFSDEHIGTNSGILTVKSGNTRIISGEYASYNGLRIGLLTGNSRNEDLADFARQNGFTYFTVYFDSVGEMLAALQEGTKVDAIFSSNLRLLRNEWILDLFDPSRFYVAVRKNDTRLLHQVNAAIKQMDNSLPDWRHRLWNRYYTAASSDEIYFTPDERRYINDLQEKKITIQAIVEPDRKPYSYFENNTAHGIIPKIFALISKKTGLSFQIREVANREQYFKAVQESPDIAVRIDSLFDYDDAEKLGYKLTEPYISTTVSSVQVKSLLGNPATVALPEHADRTEYRLRARNSGTHILSCPSVKDCLYAVRSGKADMTYVLTYTAQNYVSAHDNVGKLKTVLLPQYRVSYAIGVKNTEDLRLLTLLNKAVTNLRNTDVEQIILEETEQIQRERSFWEYLLWNPQLFLTFCLCGIILISLSIALCYRLREMQIIRRKNEELQLAAERADLANKAKTDFLSRMSHDMRTPLNGIIGMTYLARKEQEPSRLATFLKHIDISSKFLLGLINDILDMAKTENEQVELYPEPYPQKEFYEYLDSVIRPLCQEKNLQFVLDAHDVDDVVPVMDKLRFNQIVFNLLSNAVKYTPEGGSVTLRLTTDRVGQASDLTMKLCVLDTGIGISPEFQKIMFSPFVQEHRLDNNANRGSGLGLAIVKRMVDLMGGTISVKSDIGKGTCFTVTMTLGSIPATKQDGKAVPPADSSTFPCLKGIHVLLCEDHPLNQQIACALLREQGIEVEVAENGQRGVELFSRSTMHFFKAVLMDIRMPVLNGYQATKAIRGLHRPDASSVPIIAMTADAFADDISKCLAAGMNEHVAKPIAPENLITILRKYCCKDQQKPPA